MRAVPSGRALIRLPPRAPNPAPQAPAVEAVPLPVAVAPAATSAGSRTRLFATGAAVLTALLAFIHA